MHDQSLRPILHDRYGMGREEKRERGKNPYLQSWTKLSRHILRVPLLIFSTPFPHLNVVNFVMWSKQSRVNCKPQETKLSGGRGVLNSLYPLVSQDIHEKCGHVLKPEATKRKHRNETSETKPPKQPKRPKRAKRNTIAKTRKTITFIES